MILKFISLQAWPNQAFLIIIKLSVFKEKLFIFVLLVNSTFIFYD